MASLLLAGLSLLIATEASAASVIQAETFTSKDAGTVLKTAGSVSYMDFASATNAFLEWNNVSVSNAGEYRITLRYASANPTVEGLKVKVMVNGSSSALQILPATGSWTTFTDAHYIVNLNAGTNRIRVTQSTVGGPNVDYVTIAAAKTKVYTGVLNSEMHAIPGPAAGPYGAFGIPESLEPHQIRGVSCYLFSNDGQYGYGRPCSTSGANALMHYFDKPISYWVLEQPDGGGNNYSLEVRYWD